MYDIFLILIGTVIGSVGTILTQFALQHFNKRSENQQRIKDTNKIVNHLKKLDDLQHNSSNGNTHSDTIADECRLKNPEYVLELSRQSSALKITKPPNGGYSILLKKEKA